MEGLLKGVLDIALDYVKGDHDKPEKKESAAPSSSDRSQTWSQVAEGKQEEDVDSWNSEKQRRSQQHGQGGWGGDQRRQEEGHGEERWQPVGGNRRQGYYQVPENLRHEYKQSASEQHYSEQSYAADVEPTDEELQDISKAASRLWDLDSNRLVPGKDYSINVGEGKRVNDREDAADNTLFCHVDRSVFSRPTFARFYALINNYNPDEGVKENVSEEERQEELAFIEELTRTAVFQYLFRYLVAGRVISNSIEEFKQVFHNLWFNLYGRGGTRDSSSAFEHVFVGEVKKSGEVSGFHNWITLYSEEAKGRVDYRGHIFPRRGGEEPDAESQVLTIQFAWNGKLKQVSSTLLGVSPEFELALYTMCFFLGGEDNWVELGPYRVNVKCYHLGEDKIGSVYPIAD